MSFYPKDHIVKDLPSDYMKLTEGEHRIRILTSPIMGTEGWTNERKPIRFKTYSEAVNNREVDSIKEFEAHIVWDYETKMVRLLNITQRTIRKTLYDLTLDEDWNDPTSYDIVITRVGTKMEDTEYSVKPKLPKPLEKEVSDAFKQVKIEEEEYFNNGHPIVRTKAENEVSDEEALLGKSESEKVADSIPF